MTEQETPLSNRPLMSAFGLAWELGYTVAIPLVVLAGGGRLLDKYFNTSPLFLLIGVTVSIVITVYVLYKKIKEILNPVVKDDKTGNYKTTNTTKN
ncbi:MAG: AtpZ/AtpI family protein [Candidatus Kerfeldbacteria bacterium]|nr:AtpZ/AtpI family protein [Candidatus Kerfeldbacteria bacterium]